MRANLLSEKSILIAAIVFSVIGVLIFVYWQTKPKAGIRYPDLGRTHVEIGTPENYNSNPPTSGSHYPVWAKWGIYPNAIDDRHLVHSLEHGYVIMSYNCAFKPQGFLQIPTVYAQTGNNSMGSLSQFPEDGTPSALPKEFDSQDCKNLVNELTQIYNDKGQTRLILIPRPNLDALIGLTAWTYLDKFNSFDKNRINKFIDSHLNDGPEKTVE